MMLMDFREAKACIEEYGIALADTCRLLHSNVPEGEFHKQIEEISDKLVQSLNVQVKQATILSIILLEEMTAEALCGSPEQWKEVVAALNELKLAIESAKQGRDEYLSKDAERKKRGGLNEAAFAMGEFRRECDEKARQEKERRSKEHT